MIKDPIIHSIRQSNYFAADEKLAVVVICKKYDQLRTVAGRSAFEDLEEVEADRDLVLDRLARLSFTSEEIVLMEDPSYHDMNIYVRELALKVAKATAADKNILVFWYYAGHGTQDNTVSMMLNQAAGRHSYPIELQLRSLSKCNSAYVVGLMDCCR